jgi:hypothetical protein
MIRVSNPPFLKSPMRSDAQPNFVLPESLKRKHESQNPPVAGILLAAALVIVMAGACGAIIWITMGVLAKSRPLDKTITERGSIIAPDQKMLQRFPQPQLQLNPHDDLVSLRAREDMVLNGYGWVDRTNGVVRIPVERAIELLAQRGLPTREPNAPARTGKSSWEMVEERSRER